MLVVLPPSPQRVRELQEREAAYYWSGRAEDALRSLGLISVTTAVERRVPEAGSVLVLRGTEITEEEWGELKGRPLLFEAPVHASVERLLAVEVESQTTDWLDLVDFPRQGRANLIESPRPKRTVQPANGLGHGLPWNSGPVSVYDPGLPAVPGTRARTAEGSIVSLVQRRGPHTVLTVPLLDLVVQWLTYPPIEDDGHAGFEGVSSPLQAMRALLSCLLEGLSEDTPEVTCDPLPPGFRAAITLRHDYDRPISGSSCADLLAMYRKHGIVASFGFLPYELPVEQIVALQRDGHEVQVHSNARSVGELQAHQRALAALTGSPPTGMTVHGGPSGPGFLGDRHFKWAHACGMEYAETFSPRARQVVPVVSIEDESVYTMPLVVPPEHYSLDGSTRAGDHRGEALNKKLPQALGRSEPVILMNHPDIHRDALGDLLDGLDLTGVWRVSTAGLTRFAAATRRDAIVTTDGPEVGVNIVRPLSVDATYRVRARGSEDRALVISAGDTRGHVRLEEVA